MQGKSIVVVEAARMRGIGAAAAAAGVTRQHLRLVLLGRRAAGAGLRRRLRRMGITRTVGGAEL